MPAEGASEMPIHRIGKYQVEAELGFGGMGRVYRAWDPDMRRRVAIKVLLVPDNPELLRRFRLEVQTTASLLHKNIVTIYESGQESDAPYLVMELLEGKTLNEIIKSQVPLSLETKVDIMTQVADGLSYAHARGVVHRDVKPSNIMFLANGGVKILDFGVALAANRLTFTGTAHGILIGTLGYMSPEQLARGAKADEQTDIFSYGSVYYELLTGRHPFSQIDDDFVRLQMAILTQEPPLVSQSTPGCPGALNLLIQKALAKDREIRYQKFEELRLDNEGILVELRQERASRILEAVPQAVQSGDFEKASAMVRQALQLDPGSKTARQLHESIRNQIKRAQNRERIASLEAEAERHIAARQFARAVESLQAAVGLDSTNASIQVRLAEAQTRLANSSRADQLIDEARSDYLRAALLQALEKLYAALKIDPGHEGATRILSHISRAFASAFRDDPEVDEGLREPESGADAEPRLPAATSILDSATVTIDHPVRPPQDRPKSDREWNQPAVLKAHPARAWLAVPSAPRWVWPILALTVVGGVSLFWRSAGKPGNAKDSNNPALVYKPSANPTSGPEVTARDVVGAATKSDDGIMRPAAGPLHGVQKSPLKETQVAQARNPAAVPGAKPGLGVSRATPTPPPPQTSTAPQTTTAVAKEAPPAQVDSQPARSSSPRVSVGGNIMTGKLIKRTPPNYPDLAKSARIQGDVRLHALISADGVVESLNVISGHPLLIQAAMDAVKQWVYEPTFLNGQMVPVETDVDVKFTLSP